MSLLPFQQRVVVEKEELDVKVRALSAFLNAPPSGLDLIERSRLNAQYSIMRAYSQILEARIQAFKASD